jgi:hypothetical protein
MIKKLIVIVFIAHIFWCTATDQETFLQANNAYSKKDFKQALYLYQHIENKGAAVWFNMGNCWYYLEQYAEALLKSFW